MLGTSVIQALVATARPEAAKAFYGDTLGLKLVAEDAYALLFAGKIGFLRVVKAPGVMPGNQAAVAFSVEDAEVLAAALAAKGVRLERFVFLQQDANGLWTAPDGSKVGWFRDPDLNLLSFQQAG